MGPIIDVRPRPLSQPAAASSRRVGHLRVVGALEHAEAADVGRVLLVVAAVVAREDAAQRHAAAQGEELRRLAVQIERMLAAIEKLLDFHQQRRHPLRIVGINAPGNADERSQVAARTARGESPAAPRRRPPRPHQAAVFGRSSPPPPGGSSRS